MPPQNKALPLRLKRLGGLERFQRVVFRPEPHFWQPAVTNLIDYIKNLADRIKQEGGISKDESRQTAKVARNEATKKFLPLASIILVVMCGFLVLGTNMVRFTNANDVSSTATLPTRTISASAIPATAKPTIPPTALTVNISDLRVVRHGYGLSNSMPESMYQAEVSVSIFIPDGLYRSDQTYMAGIGSFYAGYDFFQGNYIPATLKAGANEAHVLFACPNDAQGQKLTMLEVLIYSPGSSDVSYSKLLEMEIPCP